MYKAYRLALGLIKELCFGQWELCRNGRLLKVGVVEYRGTWFVVFHSLN